MSLRYPDELSRTTGLGGCVALMCAAFWTWRLVWQIVYFRPRRLDVSRTLLATHYGLIVLLAALALAYGAPQASRLFE